MLQYFTWALICLCLGVVISGIIFLIVRLSSRKYAESAYTSFDASESASKIEDNMYDTNSSYQELDQEE
jgi:hypothetical protein